MNEPTKYEAELLNATDKLNRENEEWEWQMKQDKIEQNHDFMNEFNQEKEEE